MHYSRAPIERVQRAVDAALAHIAGLSDPQARFDLARELEAVLDKLPETGQRFVDQQLKLYHEQTGLSLRAIADQMAVTRARVWQRKEGWRR
jgi:hypothetical protein